MSTPRFLADMNISPQTVSALQGVGYSIIRVSGILPANSTDRVILTRARHDNLIIAQLSNPEIRNSHCWKWLSGNSGQPLEDKISDKIAWTVLYWHDTLLALESM